jgi:UDPglucose--hexose-1-phosphate uridylyltransferase
MSDFRYDPVFDQWVCIAETRQERPVEYRQIVERQPGLDCPFCRGNEHLTPPPLDRLDDPDGRWLARAVPNKYPALGPATTAMDEPATTNQGGRQEVIILSPRHVVSFAELRIAERRACMQLFQRRVRECAADPTVRHVSLFMNCRPLAGASIEHAHFQLIGSPVLTSHVQGRDARMRELADGHPLWQRELERETGSPRMVHDEADWVIWCPFASRYTGQLRMFPRNGVSLAEFDEAALVRLGHLLAEWTGAVERIFEQPAHNIVFCFPPADAPAFPWFIDLVPRFPQAAGFELATDCWINPLSPETAARAYRDQAGGAAHPKIAN